MSGPLRDPGQSEMRKKIRYGKEFVSVLSQTPQEAARRLVLLEAHALVSGLRAGKLEIAVAEKLLFNTDVLEHIEALGDEDLRSIVSWGIELYASLELENGRRALESSCDLLLAKIESQFAS